MRIVFLGNFEVSYSTETHHVQALEDLGHEVIRLQEGVATAGQILAEGRQSALFVWVHTHGWDTPGDIKSAIEELRRHGTKVITYHLDLWLGLERAKDMKTDPYWDTLDHFFTVDKRMATWLNKNTRTKGYYLPAAVSHRECYRVKNLPKTYDIIFVGSHNYHPEWPYRQELLGELSQHYGGERFKIFPGYGPAVRGRDLNILYAQARVVVGDSLCLSQKSPYSLYWSDRIYETLGRGGTLVHPAIKGLEKQFENGEHALFYEYGDFDELFECVDQLLDNPDEAERITASGHSEVHARHTYLQRWEEILGVLSL